MPVAEVEAMVVSCFAHAFGKRLWLMRGIGNSAGGYGGQGGYGQGGAPAGQGGYGGQQGGFTGGGYGYPAQQGRAQPFIPYPPLVIKLLNVMYV